MVFETVKVGVNLSVIFLHISCHQVHTKRLKIFNFKFFDPNPSLAGILNIYEQSNAEIQKKVSMVCMWRKMHRVDSRSRNILKIDSESFQLIILSE